MSDNHNPQDVYRQRVLDHALAEAVGGEAPPDLSERILERVATKDGTKNENTVTENRGGTMIRKRYLFAIAASILVLVSVGYLWMQSDIPYAREWARQNDISEWLPTEDGDAESESAVTSQPTTSSSAQADFESLLELVTQTVEPDTWEEVGGRGETEAFETDLSIVVTQSQSVHDQEPSDAVRADRDLAFPEEPPIVYPDPEFWAELSLRRKKYSETIPDEDDSLRMLVTPRIIIQEEEESQLGLDLGSREQGRGPGRAGDRYQRIVENPLLTVAQNPLSTFSIDVDTASYANVRQYLTQAGQLPPPDAVRIEELINYFNYEYAAPTSESRPPFAAHMETTGCPWQPNHRLLRIGLKGREIPAGERPPSNLVFLVDVSGSMDEPNKLPLVVRGLKTLAEHLEENDRVAIVVYASAEGLVLDSTPGTRAQEIVDVLNRLQAGGSTNGGAGIELAYQIATDHFIQGGTNRVILCTDGDFNVGTTSTAALERLAEEKAKSDIFLTVLGFGRGNLNDQMMETVSGCGNGNYYYVDSDREAQKVLVEEMGGTLVTIAKDVKIQIEFNPATVAAYRLVGYENRTLAKEDFNDDAKDAGEIGAGHTVTAIYELIPPGVENPELPPNVDPLKYQDPVETTESSDSATRGELLTLKVRYKDPTGDTSKLLTFPLSDDGRSFGQASPDTKFAASVAMFGMLLRDSRYKGNATYSAAAEIAEEGLGEDAGGYRAEFTELIRRAKELVGE